MGIFRLGPGVDRRRERSLAGIALERSTDAGLEFGAHRFGIHGIRLAAVLLERAALHEQPLGGVQRRQPVVGIGQDCDILLDAEQRPDEFVDVRREVDHQRRLGRAVAGRRVGASGGKARVQSGVGLVQPAGKCGVEPQQTVAVVQVCERKVEP